MMKLLILLVAVPFVLGGDFAGMWGDMQQEVRENFMKMKEMKDKMQQGWEDKKDDDKDGKDDDDVYSKVKSWMEKFQKQQEGREAYGDYLKDKIMSYDQYLRMQKMKEAIAKKEEQAAEKKEKMMKMRDLLAEKKKETEEAYSEKKLELKGRLAKYVVSYCGCREVKELAGELLMGKFQEYARSNSNNSGNGTSSSRQSTSQTNVTICTDGDCDSSQSNRVRIQGVELGPIADWAKSLSDKDEEDLREKVFSKMQDVICGAALSFMDFLTDVGDAVVLKLEEQRNAANTTLAPPTTT